MKSYIYLLSLLLFLVLLSNNCFASSSITDITEMGIGARPLAMGKAFIAIENDANSIILNPAGLSKINTPRFTSMKTSLLSDISYTMLGLAIPSRVGVFGVGFVLSAIPSIPLTRWTGTGTNIRPEQYGSTDYSSYVILLSYAPKLPDKISNKLNLGANLKIYSQGFSGGGASLEGATGSGYNFDLGMQFKPVYWQRFAAVITNFLPESMGGVFKWTRNNVSESIPSVFKLGYSANILGINGLKQFQDEELTVTLDAEMFTNKSKPSQLHAGIEWWPIEYCALRCGLDQKAQSSTSGIGVSNNITAGIGIKYSNFTFDYAYTKTSELDDSAAHFFSIGYVAPAK